MGASIYGNVGGVARKAKELYGNVGGVTRKLKSAYANVGGVTRKIYSGYQCQGKSLEYGTISENGAISFDVPDAKNGGQWYPIFMLHFNKPITTTSNFDIHINSATLLPSSAQLYFPITDGTGGRIADRWIKYYSHDDPTTIKFNPDELGSYTDFYFYVAVDTSGDHLRGSASAGSLYIGEPITSIELI